LILIFLLYKSRELELRQLPKEIRWSFLQYKMRPWEWEYQGSNQTGFYFKKYIKDSVEFRRVNDLFYNTITNGGNLIVESVTAVYNPTLTTSFINQWKVIKERIVHSGDIFNVQETTRRLAREHVEKHLDNVIQTYPWNKRISVPILPVCHGTDHYIAEKISQTGFAALSTTDVGYYGRGIYFTSYAQYSFPYFMSRDNPSLILAYLVVGNAYPVVEHHLKKGNLVGQALKAGFNSHYVLCNKDGFAIEVAEGEQLHLEGVFNEFVINQESQTVPAFIVDLDVSNFAQFSEEWKREVPFKRMRGQQATASGGGFERLDS